MVQYELSFLIPNLQEKEREKILKEIEEKIKSLQGKLEESFIEKKIFAYPVKKYQEGFLGVFAFSLERDRIKEFQNFLRSNQKILREIIERKKPSPLLKRVAKEKKVVLAKKPVKKQKVKIEKLDEKLKEILR